MELDKPFHISDVFPLTLSLKRMRRKNWLCNCGVRKRKLSCFEANVVRPQRSDSARRHVCASSEYFVVGNTPVCKAKRTEEGDRSLLPTQVTSQNCPLIKPKIGQMCGMLITAENIPPSPTPERKRLMTFLYRPLRSS